MQTTQRIRIAATITSLALLAACGDDAVTPDKPDPEDPVPASVAVQAGNGQEAEAGQKVPIAPAVIVRDAAGNPLAGVSVQFTVTAGGGQVAGSAPVTSSNGIASVSSWTLGTSGEQRLSAKVGSLPAAVFTATILEDVVATTDFAVGAGGGTLTINDPEHPYAGLKISVPPGTFSGSATWQFGFDEQASPGTLPSGFKQAGPPIRITTAQPRGSKLMTLEVPVTTAPGELAFIALRDASRNVAELLPVIDRTENSVVVATTHLRADLLPGPIEAAGARLGSVNTVGWMMPVSLPLPSEILGNLPSFNGEINRWPVLDYGSAMFPSGHGIGIAVMQALGTTPNYPRFTQMLKGLDKPGLYAEAGPLAAIQMVQRDVADAMVTTVGQLSQALNQHGKSIRDALLLQNVVAGVRYTGRAALVAGIAEGAGNQALIAAAAVSGAASSVSLLHSANASPIPVSISAAGIDDIAIPSVAGGVAGTISEMVPLSSFTIPTEVAHIALASLRAVHQASGAVREALNQEMARSAGQPEVKIEIQHILDGPWREIDAGKLIGAAIRSHEARIRVNTALATIHRVGGSLVSEFHGEAVKVVESLDLESEPEATPISRIFATWSDVISVAGNQISAANIQLARAYFEVTPDEVEIETGSQEVEFTAKVPMPPEAGYIIEWNWGDDEITEVNGSLTASHEYANVADYTVIATLMDASNRDKLAIDTVKVRGGASAWVGWATMSQTNSHPDHAGTMKAEANDVRFELSSGAGTAVQTYRAVSGNISVWNEVPCASYTSPVVHPVVSDFTDFESITITTSDPNAPQGSDPEIGVWFRGNAYAGGIQVRNKSCPTDQTPEPEEYVFATGTVWLNTYDNSAPWRKAANPDVLEGSYSRTQGTVTTVWTWRFERVSAGS